MQKLSKSKVLKVVIPIFLVCGVVVGAMIMKEQIKNFAAKNKEAKKVTSLATDDLWVDRNHLQTAIMIRQGALVRLTLGVHAKGKNKELRACFKGVGKNCKKFVSESYVALDDPLKEYNNSFTVQGKPCKANSGENVSEDGAGACLVERKTAYRVACATQKSCEFVEVQLESSYKGSTTVAPYKRLSKAQVAAKTLTLQ